MDSLIKLLSSELRKLADKLDAGNSNLTQEQLLESLELLSAGDKTQVLSKIEACKFMNMSRSTFDAYIKLGLIPEGKKQVGLKELTWKKLDLEITKIQIDNYKTDI